MRSLYVNEHWYILSSRSDIKIISPPPVKPEGTIGLHSVRQSVCQSVCPSVCLSVTLVFRTFLRYTFTYLDESWYIASIWRVTDQVRLLPPLAYFFMSYCPLFKIRFPDFSRLCFHISEWKLVASFDIKSYRSNSTFVTVDTLFHELLPFVQNSFSGLFSVMLSHIWMTVCRNLPHEELQNKYNFCHRRPTFLWVIALCLKFVLRTFLGYVFTYMNENW